MCFITADPPARLAAALDPLRGHADEVVIAADSRVSEEALAGYAALADKLFRIEYQLADRHLAWLHAQCSGDWILMLDGDEVPSAALVRRLPTMLSSRKVQQYRIARAWLYPDGAHALDDLPWSVDFVNRLVRNDGTLRSKGQVHDHIAAVTPCEYVDAPLYHLALLTEDETRRREKAARYDAARPGLAAVGGDPLNESFYVPEARGALAWRPIPEEDRTSVDSALSGSTSLVPRSPVRPIPVVSASEMDRLWEGRDVSEGAYRASLKSYEPELHFVPDEARPAFFYACNESQERWPADLDHEPPIRLGGRWLERDGRVHTPDAGRWPFLRLVDPGESVLVPVTVRAPAAAGEYLLEVDVVHEHVRWFGCPACVPVVVQ